MKNLAIVIEEESSELQLALEMAVKTVCEDACDGAKAYLESSKVELGGE